MRRDSTRHNTRHGEGEIESKIVTYTNENYSYEGSLPADINTRFFNFVKSRHEECYDMDSTDYVGMNSSYDRLSWFYKFTHLYIMYTQDNKTFTVHYEITPIECYDYDWNYSSEEPDIGDGSLSDNDDFDNFSISLKCIETFKFENNIFETVSKVQITQSETYYFGENYNEYTLDCRFDLQDNSFYGHNYYYNNASYDPDNFVYDKMYFVLAKD